jgi:hypothetical protein
VVSSGNATPQWNLVRVSANTGSPFFDMNRTRTHDLIITIGPGKVEMQQTPNGQTVARVVPTQGAQDAHLASQIGLAVANALHNTSNAPGF